MNKIINNEEVLYEGHLHGIIFFIPALLVLLGGYVEYEWGRSLGWLVMLIGVIWGIYSALLYYSSTLQISKKFITVQTGIFVRQTLNVSIEQLESVDVVQNILGSLLNYGSFSVRGTGGTRAFFSPVANPLTCRRFIETR